MLSASEAAKRSNRAALVAVGSALEEMHRAAEAIDDSPDSIARYNSADVGFHEALALASGNQMLSLLLESLAESLHHSFTQSFTGFMIGCRDIFDAVAEHRHIYELVAAGNPVGAERAMRRHLDSTSRDLQSYLRGADSAS